MQLSRPRLRVPKARSAFAEGNARWTNRDLDPIARPDRKWGVASLIGMPLLLYLSLTSLRSPIVIPSLLDFRCLQRRYLAICQ